MNPDLITEAGKYAGIGGIALVVIAWLLQTLLSKDIFPKLDKDRAYKIMRLVMILGFSTIVVGIGVWAYSLNLYSNSLQGETIRVEIIDQDGHLDEQATISGSRGTAHKDKEGRWEITIPPEKNLKGSKVTVHAEDNQEHVQGDQQIELTGEPTQDVRIILKRDDSQKVFGAVEDSSGTRIAGCRVFVTGYSNESAITNDVGEFKIPAHASKGETIRICLVKNGTNCDQDVQVDSTPITLTLRTK